ncbi:hypothetical protein QG37_06115 [Candidozyma auris]|nr:hypothetical protein QG37_06115 [[Candida] auris]
MHNRQRKMLSKTSLIKSIFCKNKVSSKKPLHVTLQPHLQSLRRPPQTPVTPGLMTPSPQPKEAKETKIDKKKRKKEKINKIKKKSCNCVSHHRSLTKISFLLPMIIWTMRNENSW